MITRHASISTCFRNKESQLHKLLLCVLAALSVAGNALGVADPVLPPTGQPAGFLGGTKVKVAGNQGFRYIKDLKVGDFVLSLDPSLSTGVPIRKKVTQVIKRLVDDSVVIMKVTINENALYVDKNHPFYVLRQGDDHFQWVMAGELKHGDILVSADGPSVVHSNFRINKKRASETYVYDLEVEGFHTYYVANVLVHNFLGLNPERVQAVKAGWSSFIKVSSDSSFWKARGKNFIAGCVATVSVGGLFGAVTFTPTGVGAACVTGGGVAAVEQGIENWIETWGNEIDKLN